MKTPLAQSRAPFDGCKLTLHLNGLNVLTLEEGNLIQDVLSFIGQNENRTIVSALRQRKPQNV